MTTRHRKLAGTLAALSLLAACGGQAAPAGSSSPAAPKTEASAPAAPKAQASAASAAAPAASASAKPAASALASAAAPASTAGSIRIGMITERTGPVALYGEQGMQGVQLAVDQLNAQGGLLGRKIELDIRDSKSQQDESVRQARDLLLSANVDFLITNINSAECLGDSEVAAQAKKVLFSSCGIDDYTTSKGNHYAFRVPNINSRTQGQSAAQYAADHLKNIKTVATVSNDYSFGHSVVDIFKAKYEQSNANAKFVSQLWPKFGETDYSSYITTLQNTRADMTFYFFATAIPFFNQAAPVHLVQQTPLVSAYWGGSDEVATLKQEAVPEGALMGGFPWYGIDTPENKQFLDAFRTKYNKPPGSATYFETLTMQFLSEAVKKAGSTDTEKVISALEGMTIPNTVVGSVTIRPFDHQGTTPLWIGKAKWDPQMKQGVISDLTKLGSDQFLPSQDEIKKARGQ